MSRSSKETLTLSDVDKLTFGRAMVWLENLGIELKESDGDPTLDRLKLVLKSHLEGKNSPYATGRAANPKPPVWVDTTTMALKEDTENRRELQGLFVNADEYIKQLPIPFQDDLGLVTHDRQLSTYKDELNCSQCVLLFAGEVASGKSSLINLLLDRDILPTSDLRCTAAIVEVTYGPRPLATIHWKDDSSGRAKQPFKIQCEPTGKYDQFLLELEKHVVKRDEETDESPYEMIQLQWPLDMLKGGIVIVDSPGVGDSRTLPQHLADYMERAFGFIYVIDSTTSIHRHRLGQLLMKAIEANDGFDASATLFVCNRWEELKKVGGDEDSILDSFVGKLSMILPEVTRSQLYPISVHQSREQLQYGQVSPQHKNLISGIRTLLPLSMKAKLKFYYRHLSTILNRSLYTLRMSHNMQKQHVDDLRRNQSTVEKRMRKLKQNAQNSLENMRRQVRTITVDAGVQAVQHLDSMKTRTRLLSWTKAECPDRGKSWQINQKNANFAIAARVTMELNNWEQGVNLTKKMQTDVIKVFQNEFALHENEMETIKSRLFGGTIHDEVSDERAIRGFTQSVMKAFDPKKAPQITKDRGEMNSLGAAVTSCFSLDPKDPAQKSLFKEYSSDPCRVMAQATEMYLGQMVDAKIVTALTKYFDRFVKGIDREGSFIPEWMEADQQLLRVLDQDLEQRERKLVHFPRMSKQCAEIQGRLDLFYVHKVLVPDFTADQLECIQTVGTGSFARVLKAQLRTPKGGQLQVAVKEPLDVLHVHDVTDILLEENMLRELKHENIVRYFGVCRQGPTNKVKLIMVMEYCPYTLKSEWIDKGQKSPSNLSGNPKAQTESIETITNYLVQITRGLMYLHSKPIVHRDLKPANVLLTSDHRVRIADLGLAKKVQNVATHGIGTPVYMAPEILIHYNKYDTKADIYSLAMIMWELWYGQDLADYAKDDIQGGLKVEIERGWRPTLSRREPPSPFWTNLMTKCWHADPQVRPTSEAVCKTLLQFYSNSFRRSQGSTSGAS